MNIIFLDIDGVITSTLETPGSYLNHLADEYGPSPKCVQRLLKLCDDTNSKIIISSNWRKFDLDGSWTFNTRTVLNPMSKLIHLLGNYYIGILEPIRHKPKSFALVKWLNTNKFDGNFIVFDDDVNEGFQNITEYDIKDKFIMTDPYNGLTDEDCEKAKNLLKGNNNDR